MQKIKFAIFLFIFVLFVSSNVAYAQESTIVIPSPTPQPQKTIEYDLPYPGILPGNPLYNLKMIRDRAIEFLISDPRKKAEFYLLQSDKRLNTGVYLFRSQDDKKIDLAVSTISKGENYFFKSIAELKKAKERKINISDLAGKMITSSRKHQEVILSLEGKAKKNIRNDLTEERKRSVAFEKQVKDLLSKR